MFQFITATNPDTKLNYFVILRWNTTAVLMPWYLNIYALELNFVSSLRVGQCAHNTAVSIVFLQRHDGILSTRIIENTSVLKALKPFLFAQSGKYHSEYSAELQNQQVFLYRPLYPSKRYAAKKLHCPFFDIAHTKYYCISPYHSYDCSCSSNMQTGFSQWFWTWGLEPRGC